MVTDTAQARPRRGCWGVKGAPRRLQQRAALPGVHPRHSAVPRGRRQRMGEERSSPTKPCTVLTLRKNNCFVILIGNTGTLHVLTLLLLHTSFRSLGKRYMVYSLIPLSNVNTTTWYFDHLFEWQRGQHFHLLSLRTLCRQTRHAHDGCLSSTRCAVATQNSKRASQFEHAESQSRRSP
jgi:hypothetical protein